MRWIHQIAEPVEGQNKANLKQWLSLLIFLNLKGIIESDDISLVALEIEKSLNFSKKAALLIESVKKKYGLVSSDLSISCNLS